MFVNAYDFTLEKTDGTSVDVSLRLGAGAQLKLKKKYNESTKETIFEAIDDVERFIDVMDAALKWTGNKNTIKNGEELLDLMIVNGMLGVVKKLRVLSEVARASGVFDEEEYKQIIKKADKEAETLFADDDEDKATKNA